MNRIVLTSYSLESEGDSESIADLSDTFSADINEWSDVDGDVVLDTVYTETLDLLVN